MRGSVEGKGLMSSWKEGAVMRLEMSRLNKLILALPDQSHVQLVPLLPGDMFNKPVLLGN